MTPGTPVPSGVHPARPQIRPDHGAWLRPVALQGLARMFNPDAQQFVFTVRRTGDGVAPEGLSPRYTAIALIGLAGEPPTHASAVLGGRDVRQVCETLVERATRSHDVGDVALTCWAALETGATNADLALDRLAALEPHARACPIVDLSWTLSALAGDPSPMRQGLRAGVAARLMSRYNAAAGGFPHEAGSGPAPRTHVACFADQVYPILALSQYAAITGDERAVTLARATADRICRAQGPAGQWWWHYDARIDALVERYPVYSVHQHAMAPMALAALTAVSGADYSAAIDLGVRWLEAPPEDEGRSLVDRDRGVIWRKIGRREMRKASRYVQAAVTMAWPGARLPGLDRIFPAGTVDFECRPYELGWLLYTWPPASDGRRGADSPPVRETR